MAARPSPPLPTGSLSSAAPATRPIPPRVGPTEATRRLREMKPAGGARAPHRCRSAAPFLECAADAALCPRHFTSGAMNANHAGLTWHSRRCLTMSRGEQCAATTSSREVRRLPRLGMRTETILDPCAKEPARRAPGRMSSVPASTGSAPRHRRPGGIRQIVAVVLWHKHFYEYVQDTSKQLRALMRELRRWERPDMTRSSRGGHGRSRRAL